MLIDSLSLDDKQQLLADSLVMWQERPVKIKNITDKKLFIFDILSQRTLTADAPFLHFGFGVPRIGNVNIDGTVFNIVRRPARLFTLGLTKQNVSVKEIPFKGFEFKGFEDGGYVMEKLHSLERKEIGKAIIGKYPSFKEAVSLVLSQEMQCCAFDHQLSISADGGVFYREVLVGGASGLNKETNFSDIKFSNRYEYVRNLYKENQTERLHKAQKGCKW